jgi:glucose/arabinose dehydrogenase
MAIGSVEEVAMRQRWSAHHFFIPLLALASFACGANRTEDLRAPPGFEVRRLTLELPGARQMALAPSGTLFVGTRREGKVYAVPRALTADPGTPIEIARKLTMPNGVAFRDGDLWVAATHEILRFEDIETRLAADASYVRVAGDLPTETHHGWKYLAFGPDQMLYVPVGAPCNICRSDDPRFASILRMDPDTGEATVFAHGIRNSVGLEFHPRDGALWFTDNGRDLLGDDRPPEEVNVATRAGQHFGYPFLHGSNVTDPDFGAKGPGGYLAPVVEIQAHSAALGVAFYTGSVFPERYRNALFIAEHGSWNRSSKVGYQVSVVTFESGAPVYAPFVTGWLDGNTVTGRPVDVLVTPSGSLLVSDDKGDAVWEISYRPPHPD